VVSDDKGTESDPVTQQVTVPSINTDLPKAKIEGATTGQPATIMSFDGRGSTPSGDIQKYEWNFADPNSGAGNNLSGKDANTAQHSFTANGSYHVTLKVTDSLGQNDTAEVVVNIGAAGPLAVCDFTPKPPLQGVQLTFDGSGSSSPGGATIKAWLWDFD